MLGNRDGLVSRVVRTLVSGRSSGNAWEKWKVFGTVAKEKVVTAWHCIFKGKKREEEGEGGMWKNARLSMDKAGARNAVPGVHGQFKVACFSRNAILQLVWGINNIVIED